MNFGYVFLVLLSFQAMFGWVLGDSVNSIPSFATENVNSDRSWSQPILSLLAAGTGVTATLAASTQTRPLVFSSFNTSSISTSAIITGIVAQVFHSATSGTTTKLNSISWNSTTLASTAQSNGGNIPTGTPATTTFGSSTDKWGTALDSISDLASLQFTLTYNFPGVGGPQTDITNFGMLIVIHFTVPTTGTTAIRTTGTTGKIITTGTTGKIVTTGTTGKIVTTGTTGKIVTTGTTGRIVTTGTTARVLTTGTTGILPPVTTGIPNNEGNGIISPPAAGAPVGIIVGATIGGVVLLGIVVGVAIFVKVQFQYKQNREAMRQWGSSENLNPPQQDPPQDAPKEPQEPSPTL